MRRAVVVGVGSPFAGDDLGWRAAAALREGGFAVPGHETEYVCSDRPGVGLLALMEGRELAILLDAMCSGAPPGSVRRLRRAELARLPVQHSSHGLGVAEALALGERLDLLPPRLLLLGIETGGPAPGFHPQALEACLRRALAAPG